MGGNRISRPRVDPQKPTEGHPNVTGGTEPSSPPATCFGALFPSSARRRKSSKSSSLATFSERKPPEKTSSGRDLSIKRGRGRLGSNTRKVGPLRLASPASDSIREGSEHASLPEILITPRKAGSSCLPSPAASSHSQGPISSGVYDASSATVPPAAIRRKKEYFLYAGAGKPGESVETIPLDAPHSPSGVDLSTANLPVSITSPPHSALNSPLLPPSSSVTSVLTPGGSNEVAKSGSGGGTRNKCDRLPVVSSEIRDPATHKRTPSISTQHRMSPPLAPSSSNSISSNMSSCATPPSARQQHQDPEGPNSARSGHSHHHHHQDATVPHPLSTALSLTVITAASTENRATLPASGPSACTPTSPNSNGTFRTAERENRQTASSSSNPITTSGGLVGGAGPKLLPASVVATSPTATAKTGASRRGIVGLKNLGNTCFMNATLQCLLNIEPLVQYFLTDEYKAHLQTRRGMKGQLMEAFADLVRKVHGDGAGASVVSPHHLKTLFGTGFSAFAGYRQQDAQEFLRYLLDGLHEDSNRIRKPPPYQELKDIKGELDAQTADRWWQYYRSRHDSYILDLFCGQLRSHVTCTKCKTISKAFDPFWDLSLNLPKTTKNSCSLQECISRFAEDEKLSGPDAFKCQSCQKQRDAKKKMGIHRFPDILVLHLKRFRNQIKLNDDVHFPKQRLCLKELAEVSGYTGSVTYDLIGVIHHIGGLGGGHYTAECKNWADGQWYTFDDTHVSKTSESKVGGPSAYVLFYQRVPVVS